MSNQSTTTPMFDVDTALAALRREVTGPAAADNPSRAAIAAKRAEAERLHAEADLADALADIEERLTTARVAREMALATLAEQLDRVQPAKSALAAADVAVADLRQQLDDLAAIENPSRDVRAMRLIVAEDLEAVEAARRPAVDQLAAATRDFNAAGREATRLDKEITTVEAQQRNPLTVYDIPAALTRAVRTHWRTLLAAKAGDIVGDQELALATVAAHALYTTAGLSAQAAAIVERQNDRQDGNPFKNAKGATS